jgi:hypothetical protein
MIARAVSERRNLFSAVTAYKSAVVFGEGFGFHISMIPDNIPKNITGIRLSCKFFEKGFYF